MFGTFLDYAGFSGSIHEFHADLLGLAIQHCEGLRVLRGDLAGADAQLLCDNMVFGKPAIFDSFDGHRLLQWPHWILKCLYTEKALMFGKFWPEENGVSQKGMPIPQPPCLFLSIRASVRPKDPTLLKSQEEFASLIADAEDDGGDVFAHIGLNKSEVIESLANTSSRSEIYTTLKEWSKQHQTNKPNAHHE